MPDRVRIVVIDDNPGSLELLSSALSREHVMVFTAANPNDGVELVEKYHPQLVITDLVMPGMTGLDVLDRITAIDPAISVILMTAHYTTDTAVEAIRRGAADYLQKPVKVGLLRERIATLLASADVRRRAGKTRYAEEFEFSGMVAQSRPMWDLFALVERVAPHYRSVLIEGPTGTGKDLVAKALHERSGVGGQMVVLNCSAVVETLFESELFGHTKGAFTGADREKIGLLELASGGTLFLDEIGDMPMATQAKLLRALQNGEVQPVGSLTPRKVNLRVIAATHKDLNREIAEGRFREDLFYRLSMVELQVPALRERSEDVVLLARYFVRRFSREFDRAITGITPRAALVLERYGWPGNVRELEHVMGRACMLADGPMLDVEDLPDNLVHAKTPVVRPEAAAGYEATPGAPTALADHERRLVEEALRAAAGNQSEAARRLGIGRDALRYKMKRFNLLQ